MNLIRVAQRQSLLEELQSFGGEGTSKSDPGTLQGGHDRVDSMDSLG